MGGQEKAFPFTRFLGVEMEPSEACRKLVKESEGFSSHPYVDAAGFKTVYWGHKIKPGETFDGTESQAETVLDDDLRNAAQSVVNLVHVPLTQGQFDALADFVFNMGAGRLAGSTLLKLLNDHNYAGACRELCWQDETGKFHGWVYAGGTILGGLVTRRQKEQALWTS